ncbi:glycosyltransferase [Marinitoga arctica]
MKILAIVPARGGSKGIKKKNIRLLNNKPLITYIINTAKNSHYITDIVVTTDNEDIIDVVKLFDVKIRKRPKNLAEDNITLDPVIYDAYEWYKNNYSDVDYVITLQPTSPLLTKETLEKAIQYMIDQNYDTVLSVVDNTHLEWKKENKKIIPNYSKRLNRQWLPKKYKETGAFVISKKEFISYNNRFGEKISVFEIPTEEAIDIDTPLDWYIAEKIMQRLNILFVTSGNSEIGMGHIYRTVTLAETLIGHNIDFFLVDTSEYAKKIISINGFKYYENDIDSLYKIAKKYDIIVNDFLDTSEEYMNNLKKSNNFIVNFEDLSIYSDKANLVINSLYERIKVPQNHKYGYEYCVLKEDFLLTQPNNFSDEVKNILITFGGVDKNNLTLKSVIALQKILKKRNIKIKIIIGPGYKELKKLNEIIQNIGIEKNIEIIQNVRNMAKEMKNIDLALTSNGRTVYELASMRIPIISIAQNDRETLHTFARYNNGVKYLGIACNVDENKIYNTILDLLNNKEERFLMYKNLPYKELRTGINRVKNTIIEYYWRWRNDKNR